MVPGWDCVAFRVAILGVDMGTILCRALIADRMQPRVLFVSNLWGSAYGSTSMDCRHPLCNWVRGVANLQREISAAANAGSYLTYPCATKSGHRNCFGVANG